MLNANRAAYITLIGFCRCRRRRRRCCWRCRRDQKKISTGKMQREWNQKRSNDGIQLQPSNNCAPSAELNSQFPWSEDGRAKENEMMEEPATERKTCLKQMAQQNIKLWLHVICGRREKFTDRWNNNNIIIFLFLQYFAIKAIDSVFHFCSVCALPTSLRAHSASRSHHLRFAFASKNAHFI